MRQAIAVVMLVPLIGCHSTRTFSGNRDEVFAAAIAWFKAEPNSSTELTKSDPKKGTFEGVFFDGQGNVYLRGRVYTAQSKGETRTVLDIDCWSWGMETLFLIPFNDAPYMEKQFLDTVEDELAAKASERRSASFCARHPPA